MFKNIASLCAIVALVCAISINGEAVAADKKKSDTSTSPCQGLTKTKCKSNKGCLWVEGYTTKEGTKVKSYCRLKPSKDDKKKADKKKSNK